MASPAPSQAYVDAIASAMARVLDLRDYKTGAHSTEIVELALAVGNHYGFNTSELHNLEISATLHDLGKIGIPDHILHKPAKLEQAEVDEMRRHPEYGWGVLKELPGFDAAARHILHHHERWDGAGYPSGLSGEEIPIGARIIAVVDAYHAMIEDRPYRKGMPREEAWRNLEAAAGSQFDPDVVTAFVSYARVMYPAHDETGNSAGK